MKIAACLAASMLALSAPAMAQTMDHSHHMPGAGTPAGNPAVRAPAVNACTPEHAAMGHCVPETAPESPEHGGMEMGAQAVPAPQQSDPGCPPEHAAMGHCTPKTETPMPTAGMGQSGTALPAGNAPAPAAPLANYSDRVWGADAMMPARSAMMNEHGGMTFSQIMLDIAELRIARGREGYVWGAEAWFGGDIHGLTVKSEGEGAFGGSVESAEVQMLYSRAIGPYFNLQAGIRQDIRPKPARTFAVLGVEGLAPYWFEVEGGVFLSDKGDVLVRLGGYYDQRITQRLALQPRMEVNFSAQTMRAEGIGSGLVDAEAGLRLRYEVLREFAPYLGISWERKFGETARQTRSAGDDTGGFAFVAGIRAWF